MTNDNKSGFTMQNTAAKGESYIDEWLLGSCQPITNAGLLITDNMYSMNFASDLAESIMATDEFKNKKSSFLQKQLTNHDLKKNYFKYYDNVNNTISNNIKSKLCCYSLNGCSNNNTQSIKRNHDTINPDSPNLHQMQKCIQSKSSCIHKIPSFLTQ